MRGKAHCINDSYTDSQANSMRMRVTSWRTMAEDWMAGGVGSLMSDIEAGKSVEYVCW